VSDLDHDPTAIDIYSDPLRQTMRGIAVHGNTPFEVPYMTHVVGNLWTGGCAQGLVVPKHIEHLVSLYPWEEYRAKHTLKSKLTVRMYDSNDLPNPLEVESVAAWVAGRMHAGPTLLHCQAGLNRSALIAVATLTLWGYSAADAIALLREKRSPAVLCNKTFETWLLTEL
jgi:protein-tyrosine phosphatase